MPNLNLPELVCYRVLTWTWPFYSVGALYLVGPALAVGLLALLGTGVYLAEAAPPSIRPAGPVPPVVAAWLCGMTAMLVVLWAGHAEWDLGIGQTIKSSIGWAKGWALLAFFALAGALLPIGRAPLVRGQCVVGLWTLCLLPLLLAAPMLGLPSKLFVSPLSATGGPGPEYFSVYLFTLDPESNSPRWQFYVPWSPFAGLLGLVMVLFALEERHRGWKLAGLGGGVAMIVMSQSRMSLLGLVICIAVPRLAPLVAGRTFWVFAAASASAFAVLGASLLRVVEDAVQAFNGARAGSSRVRATLQQIAFERWQTEAPLVGHGTVERGPHLVEYMMIGSHHTWFGLLFVKGLIGVAALAVPMAWQFCFAAADAVRGVRGRLPFGLMLNFTILTFGENLEIETYMLWPAILLLGVHAREVSMEAGRGGSEPLRGRNPKLDF